MNNAAGGGDRLIYPGYNSRGLWPMPTCPHWVTLTGPGVRLIMGGIGRLSGPIVMSVSTQRPLGVACGIDQLSLSLSLSCLLLPDSFIN